MSAIGSLPRSVHRLRSEKPCQELGRRGFDSRHLHWPFGTKLQVRASYYSAVTGDATRIGHKKSASEADFLLLAAPLAATQRSQRSARNESDLLTAARSKRSASKPPPTHPLEHVLVVGGPQASGGHAPALAVVPQ